MPPSTKSATLATMDANALSAIMQQLPFDNMCHMPRVCTAVRDACAAIDGGWKPFVEARVVRFNDNTQYCTTPTGWINTISIHTIKLTKGTGRMVLVGGKRTKLRMRGGVEYVQLGPNYKYPKIYATDKDIDEDRIRSINGYWMMNK